MAKTDQLLQGEFRRLMDDRYRLSIPSNLADPLTTTGPDCIAVKESSKASKQTDCSKNYLIENIRASGLGLTIGSIGPSGDHNCVDNVTFRNIYMERCVIFVLTL